MRVTNAIPLGCLFSYRYAVNPVQRSAVDTATVTDPDGASQALVVEAVGKGEHFISSAATFQTPQEELTAQVKEVVQVLTTREAGDKSIGSSMCNLGVRCSVFDLELCHATDDVTHH
jgi:hypothetical protein